MRQTPVFGKCSLSVPRDGDQLGEASLAVDQRQVAQVVVVMLNQVEGEQHRLIATALAPERLEVRHPVIAGDHDLAVDQERRSRRQRKEFRNAQSWLRRKKG